MSLEKIKQVFGVLKENASGDYWQLQLLQINEARSKVSYQGRRITLAGSGRLKQLLQTIIANYTAEKGKRRLENFRVEPYDGSGNGTCIYKLSADDLLIAENYEAFITAVADPSVEGSAKTYDDYDSAYVLMGDINLGKKETVPVKFVSMHSPIMTLKNKFYMDAGTFKEITKSILSLTPMADVVIIGKDVYFFTLEGEKLFRMERAYRKRCDVCVNEVEASGLLEDFKKFADVAKSGRNPRRFLSFNASRLKALKKNREVRLRIAKTFDIPLNPAGTKLVAGTDEVADKIVRVLCDKGMTDPFHSNSAVEVDGARKWK